MSMSVVVAGATTQKYAKNAAVFAIGGGGGERWDAKVIQYLGNGRYQLRWGSGAKFECNESDIFDTLYDDKGGRATRNRVVTRSEQDNDTSNPFVNVMDVCRQTKVLYYFISIRPLNPCCIRTLIYVVRHLHLSSLYYPGALEASDAFETSDDDGARDTKTVTGFLSPDDANGWYIRGEKQVPVNRQFELPPPRQLYLENAAEGKPDPDCL